MDPGTLAGVVLALVAIMVSTILEGGSPMSLVLIPPIILVLFGTLGAAMAAGTMQDTITALTKYSKVGLLAKKANDDGSIDVLVKLAERARKEGLLALEDAIKTVEDPFLRKGLEMAVDGTDPEELREILEAQIDAKRKADSQGAKFYMDAGGYSPTLGIIGTVMGLVHVLENLSTPAELGHLIAGAFVATLWGVMLANIVWLPLGNKIKRVSGMECHHMEVLVEGVLAIQAGANPRMIAQKLRSLLPDVAEKNADKKKAA